MSASALATLSLSAFAILVGFTEIVSTLALTARATFPVASQMVPLLGLIFLFNVCCSYVGKINFC